MDTKAQVKGNIFNIQRFSIQDGPGIRTIVFFKGCNLKCLWCSNPESKKKEQQLFFQPTKCIGCNRCYNSCPKGAISKGAQWWQVDNEKCDSCGICTEACCSEAMLLKGQYKTADEVMDIVTQDMLIYTNSGGGVTFSGGEPTLQIDFLNELLEKSKKAYIHTALETNGFAAREKFDRIKDKVDLFLFDIKLMDSAKHIQYTGQDNKVIQDNFKYLIDQGCNVVARCPLIPSINTDDENLIKMREFFVESSVKEIHLLPYHRLGINKYDSIKEDYKLRELVEIEDNRIDEIEKILTIPNTKLKVFKH